MTSHDIYPPALTLPELLRIADSAELEDSLRGDPWSPLQKELLVRLRALTNVKPR